VSRKSFDPRQGASRVLCRPGFWYFLPVPLRLPVVTWTLFFFTGLFFFPTAPHHRGSRRLAGIFFSIMRFFPPHRRSSSPVQKVDPFLTSGEVFLLRVLFPCQHFNECFFKGHVQNVLRPSSPPPVFFRTFLRFWGNPPPRRIPFDPLQTSPLEGILLG